MLSPWSLSPRDAESESLSFRAWMNARSEFGEAEVVAELRRRPNLCLLIHFVLGVGTPDRLRWEVSIEGVFRADLVTGSSAAANFVLIEFEDGRHDSLFKARHRDSARLRSWSPRLEHALGQVADWSWAKSQRSVIYETAFGARRLTESYLIVCGRRDPAMDEATLDRLDWRCNKTQIAACGVRLWTYDDLLINLEAAVTFLRNTVTQGVAEPGSIAASVP